MTNLKDFLFFFIVSYFLKEGSALISCFILDLFEDLKVPGSDLRLIVLVFYRQANVLYLKLNNYNLCDLFIRTK